MRFPDAHDDKQFFRAQPDGVVQKDNPVVGPLFGACQQIIPELLDPQQNRVRRGRLEGHVQILTDDLTTFRDGSKTGRRLQFEGDERLNSLQAVRIATGALQCVFCVVQALELGVYLGKLGLSALGFPFPSIAALYKITQAFIGLFEVLTAKDCFLFPCLD